MIRRILESLPADEEAMGVSFANRIMDSLRVYDKDDERISIRRYTDDIVIKYESEDTSSGSRVPTTLAVTKQVRKKVAYNLIDEPPFLNCHLDQEKEDLVKNMIRAELSENSAPLTVRRQMTMYERSQRIRQRLREYQVPDPRHETREEFMERRADEAHYDWKIMQYNKLLQNKQPPNKRDEDFNGLYLLEEAEDMMQIRPNYKLVFEKDVPAIIIKQTSLHNLKDIGINTEDSKAMTDKAIATCMPVHDVAELKKMNSIHETVVDNTKENDEGLDSTIELEMSPDNKKLCMETNKEEDKEGHPVPVREIEETCTEPTQDAMELQGPSQHLRLPDILGS